MDFDTIIFETLKRSGIDFRNEKDVINKTVVLINYLLKGEFKYIPRKDNMRDIVMGMTRNEIMKCISDNAAVHYLDSNQLIPSYAQHVARFYPEYINSISKGAQSIEQIVQGLNLNDKLKQWIISQWYQGDENVLRGYVSQEIIEQLKQAPNQEKSLQSL